MGGKNRKWTVFAVIFVVVIITCLAVELYRGGTKEPRHKAEEYFEISNVQYEGFEEGPDLWVTMVSFDLSPIGGDAHEVYVTPTSGMTEPVELGTIEEGASTMAFIRLDKAVYLRPKEEGFPFEITISCHEAYGKVTIYIK